GDEPGGAAEEEGGDPAGMDPGQRIAPASLDNERDDGAEHEDRLEAFAEEDDERSREGRRLREAVLPERFLGCGKKRVQVLSLGLQVLQWRAALDVRAEREHPALDIAHEAGIDVGERGLHKL